MDSSTVSSGNLTCQEDLLSEPAIEVLGVWSIISMLGVLGLLLWPALLAKRKSDIGITYRHDCVVKYTAGTLGVLGAVIGVIGMVGNLVLGPIILAECGTADYTYHPSLMFSITLGILILGIVPAAIFWFAQKKTAFFAVLVTFAIVTTVTYFVGAVATLFHWSQYTKTK